MAAQQPTAQRLLLVFCKAELPEDATPQQKADFEAGEGGMLAPLATVDKFPVALGSFAELSAEAEQHGLACDLPFISSMERGDDSAALHDRVQDGAAGAGSRIRIAAPQPSTHSEQSRLQAVSRPRRANLEYLCACQGIAGLHINAVDVELNLAQTQPASHATLRFQRHAPAKA
ncbi:MAG: hypothetical protein OEW36_00400 [Hylemonella sp.]|nr:hypothetical protein [Hylemonella sp.]